MMVQEFVDGMAFAFGCTVGVLFGIGFIVLILNFAHWLKEKMF